MVLGCSQNISESLKNPLVITSEREIISDLEKWILGEKYFQKNNMKNLLELYQKNFLKCLDGNIKIKNAAQF